MKTDDQTDLKLVLGPVAGSVRFLRSPTGRVHRLDDTGETLCGRVAGPHNAKLIDETDSRFTWEGCASWMKCATCFASESRRIRREGERAERARRKEERRIAREARPHREVVTYNVAAKATSREEME